MLKCFLWLNVVALAVLAMMAQPAFAHRMNISAWLENDSIIVEANLGPNDPAKNAQVLVFDKDTQKELAQGKTDAAGRYVFAVPEIVREGHGIEIAVNAGQGHRGTWSMDASELYAAASLTAGFDQARIEEARAAKAENDHVHVEVVPSQPRTLQTPAGPTGQPAGDDLKKIIHDALEVQLAPIRQQIAAQKGGGITLVEIIGGLGWIMGIVGTALFFMSRRRAD